ncbi:MAG: hypothetical protein J6C64_16150 [Lachnospiraceae bacterium]|nr:hypothetical protein [Lachnospiraceae bacterium]
MKKKLVFLTLIISLLSGICACADQESNSPEVLQDLSYAEREDYVAVVWDERVYVPFCAVDNSLREKQIGIVNGDENDKVYEAAGLPSEEWIIACYVSGMMDGSMLMKEENVKEIPNGLKSEYTWNQENFEDVENSEEVITAPSREEVLAMRARVLDGMSDEAVERLKENIKIANQTMEKAYMYDNLFKRLSDADDLYWNYIDQKGDIQIGDSVTTYNRFDADNFIALMEEMKISMENEMLKADFDNLIDNMEQAKETHDVEYIKQIYYILHDMDYFLLRYGPEDVGKYTKDTSTVSTYYGSLKVYK